MTLHLRYVAHSETGLVRKNNQDSGYASPRLLAVADGMGGAAAGDLASAVAVAELRTADAPASGRVDEPVTGRELLDVLGGTLRTANERIAALIRRDYSLDGMGTTVTAMLFDGTSVGLAHLGDSRAYLLREDHLERLTHDHSWVQSLVDTGKISEADAAVHPHRSLLLKVLNGQPANEPDLTLLPLRAGDRLLLCSDGLCGLVDDPDLETLLKIPDLNASLEALTEAALAAGGIDNITIILAEARDANEPPSAVDEPVVLGAAAERAVPQPGAVTAADEREDTIPVAGARSALAVAVDADEDDEELRAGEDEDRYVPQPPTRGGVGRRLALLFILVVVLGGLVGAGYAWTRTQYYVGESASKVAIFQGMSEGFPGLGLSRVYQVQPVEVADLPPFFREQVQATIQVKDLSAARKTVQTLSEAAARCRDLREHPTPTPTTPTRRPSASATAHPTTHATASVSSKPQPLPTASAQATASPTAPDGQTC